MDIRKLQRAIVDGLEDVKAQNIVVFNTEHLSSMFERVIIASGSSNRQTKALASSVRESVKSRGMQVMATEGEDNGEWIIVDCGAAVAHIMQPAIREYYHLEEIWGGKNVKLKLGEAKVGLVKASEPEPEPRAARRRSGAAAPRLAAGQPTTKAPTRAPASAPARAPVKAATKAPARLPARTPAKTPAKPSTTVRTTAPARSLAKAPARAPVKGPGKAPAKTPVKAAATSSGRTAPKPPAKAAPKVKTLVIAPNKPTRKTAAAKKAVPRKSAARSR